METIVSYTKKIKYIAIFYVIACMIIMMRLTYLQVYLNKDLHDRARHNFLRVEKVYSRRGNILDCNGKLLATNRPITNIYWRGSGNRQLTTEQQATLQKVAELLGITIEQTQLSAIKYAERTSKDAILFSNATFEQLGKITELFPTDKNINITTELKRCYPYGSKASHVIGYISSMNSEGAGKMGIEKMFEPMLRGQEGTVLKMINSVGTNLYAEELSKALAGQDIATTLDLTLQDIAEESFPLENGGCLLIMDPEDGALKAIVSRPAFDPALFLDPIPLSEWQLLQEKKPFLNRTVCCYPPASPFKLVTLSAALENKLINPEMVTYCKGFTRFRGRKYHCANRDGHGALSVHEAVAKSCNILFFEIAKKISIDTLADYAHRFGLGEKTNILLPENTGLVPTSEWKRRVKREPWWPGENLSAVIGQSYYLVTPLQTARMIASIFTGYLVNPRIIASEPVIKKPLAIKPETRQFLKKTMEAVVTIGTAQRTNKINNVKVYAKTGTAQIFSMETQESGELEPLYHAWFAGRFRYKKEKPLVMVLLVENVSSSKEAPKVAKKFFVNYRNMMAEKESAAAA
ncbi:MAG TPA: penicillin-binding transpeptidase domain-containing protein [Candidatus Babeliales bacterium]|nr:penicillin-binding transpeptidase domain-containing protein [Candidatus Babeliales bacterium]